MNQITHFRIVLVSFIICFLSIGLVCGMAVAEESAENSTSNVTEIEGTNVEEPAQSATVYDSSADLAKLQAALEAANAQAAEDYAALNEKMASANEINANISEAIAAIGMVSEQAAADKAALDAALAGATISEENGTVVANTTN